MRCWVIENCYHLDHVFSAAVVLFFLGEVNVVVIILKIFKELLALDGEFLMGEFLEGFVFEHVILKELFGDS